MDSHASNNDATQAAERLNQAFRDLENKISFLQTQVTGSPELEILEQENQQLHNALLLEQDENARLKDSVRQLSTQLEQAITRVEKLMEMAEA